MTNTREVHEHHYDGSGSGAFLAVVVVMVIAVLFIIFGLPALRSSSNPEINVPDKINVDVNKVNP